MCRTAARLSFFAEKIAASFPGWACTGSAALGLHPHAGSDRPPPLRPRQPREASLVASGMEGRGWGCVLAQGRGLADGFQVGRGGAGVRVAGAQPATVIAHRPQGPLFCSRGSNALQTGAQGTPEGCVVGEKETAFGPPPSAGREQREESGVKKGPAQEPPRASDRGVRGSPRLRPPRGARHGAGAVC